MSNITKLIIMCMIGILSGCTPMNSKFNCPNKPGVTCHSLDQVNDMVDRGVIGRDERVIAKIKNANQAYIAMQNINRKNLANQFNSLRVGEEVVRIWIAPYQDINNNYHNESSIYTVVRKNNWAVPTEVSE